MSVTNFARRNSMSALTALAFAAGLAVSASAQPQPAPAPAPAAVAPAIQPGAHPAPTPGQPNAAANFPLKFDHTSFDWGSIPDTDKVTHTFKFTNSSDKTVSISGLQGSCGCTAGTLTKNDYSPGEAGEITATFDPTNRVGAQPKTLTVTLKDTSYTPFVLNLTSTVKPYVYADQPKLQFMETLKGTQSTQSFHVIGRSEDFSITGVDVSDPNLFSVKIGTPEAFEENGDKLRRVAIDVTVANNLPIGNHNAQLTVKTSDTRKPTIQSFASAQIVGEVRCSPPMMFIRVNQPSQPFDTQVQMDSRVKKNFEIKSVDVEGPSEMGLVADFEATTVDGAPAYLVKLSGVTPPVPGQYRGTVSVATDVPDEGETKITFFVNILNAQGMIPPAAPVMVPPPGTGAAAAPFAPSTGTHAPTSGH